MSFGILLISKYFLECPYETARFGKVFGNVLWNIMFFYRKGNIAKDIPKNDPKRRQKPITFNKKYQKQQYS